MNQQSVTSALIAALRSFVAQDVQVVPEVDEEGVLLRVTLRRPGAEFTVYGDDWTWELRATRPARDLGPLPK